MDLGADVFSTSISLVTDRNDGGQHFSGVDFDVHHVQFCPTAGLDCVSAGGSCSGNGDGFCTCSNSFACQCECVPEEDPTGNYLFSLGIAFFSLQALATALAVGWTVWNRKSTVVHASQPEFLSLVAIGCLILASAILPLSIEGKYMFYTENVYNGCMAVPWLLCIVSEVWTKLRCIH